MRRHGLTLVTAALIGAVTLAACGSTDDAVEAETETGDEAITIVDGRGEEVTLPDGPATKIVALEWAQAEMVITLGGDLVGLADSAGYTSWVGEAAPLPSEPTDVGVRREPSVETISELDPDLIIGGLNSIPDEAMSQMERVAPVALLSGAEAADPLGTIRGDFETIAEMLGEQDQAEQVLADMDATFAENGAAIEAAGLDGTPIVLTSPYADGANLTIRMHGPRTAVQEVAVEMGLTDAWEEPGDDAFGLSNIDLEGLTELPDDTVFTYWGNDDSEDVVETSLEGNPLWESLPFVESGNVHRAAVGIWAYGGPDSLTAWSDELVEILGA